jgi:hypothetical protein
MCQDLFRGELLTSVIRGLESNGHHDECRTSLLTLGVGSYRVAVTNQLGTARDVLLQASGGMEVDVAALDVMIATGVPSKLTRKGMEKVMFRAIGVHVSQATARPTKVKDLQESLFLLSDQKPTAVEDTEQMLENYSLFE